MIHLGIDFIRYPKSSPKQSAMSTPRNSSLFITCRAPFIALLNRVTERSKSTCSLCDIKSLYWASKLATAAECEADEGEDEEAEEATEEEEEGGGGGGGGARPFSFSLSFSGRRGDGGLLIVDDTDDVAEPDRKT